MRRIVSCCLAALICLVLTPDAASAQGTSAASISGVVKDTSGGVLPGVTVEASSPALIEGVRSVTTNDAGLYRIAELRPGIYTVKFTLPGFGSLQRDGLELSSNFTANVNVELSVGDLQETVVVTGASPLVDVQNVNQQKTISKDLLDAVPTGKSVLGFAALMPSAVNPGTAQDVGGSMGESSVRISVHGAKQSDQKLLQDGMSYNVLGGGGTGRTFFINPLAAQEIVIDVGAGGSAEYPFGGAIVNLIPKDGGNRFSGSFFAAGTNHALQANNLDDDLRAQGLTTVNGVREIYDANAVLGGPILQDKLWFMTAYRVWGRESRFANLFADADITDWLFTPDPNRPGDAGESFRANNVRLTWQAAAKHKITGSYDRQVNHSNVQGGALGAGVRSLEAITNPDVYCNQPNVIQGTWNSPFSSNLLFEAGTSTLLNYRSLFEAPCGGLIYENSVTEQSTGFIYHGSSRRFTGHTFQSNQRFSTTYVTGAHTFKTGATYFRSFRSEDDYTESGRAGFPVDYRFNMGIPNRLTQWVSPRIGAADVKAAIGVFAQDQWRVWRTTISMGVRYEYHNAYAPAHDEPAGLLGPAASTYEEANCLPCWHDLNPRLAAAWDVFGDGKTAVKASVGRYVEAVTTEWAGAFGPAGARVLSTNRTWGDTNGNFFPDCDLRDTGPERRVWGHGR